MAKEVCEDCGKVFEAGPKAFFCPACRKRRMSEAAKRRGQNKVGYEARSRKREGKK